MPLVVSYFINSPGSLLRQILAIQIIMAFTACFLIFITTNQTVYRDASVYSSERQNTISPYTIILSASTPTKDTNSIAFIQQMHQQLSSNCPRIVIYTSSTSVSDDDGQILDISDPLLHQQPDDSYGVAPMAPADLVTASSRKLLVKVLKTVIKKKQYDGGIILWIDPTITLANAHLLRELPNLVLQNNNAGIWAPKSGRFLVDKSPCNIPRILGFDASNKVVVNHLLTTLLACEQQDS